MKKWIMSGALAALVMLSACVTEPEEKKDTEKTVSTAEYRAPAPSSYHNNPAGSWIWNTAPRNGQAVFFASSGLRANRDDERIYSLQSAAIKASQFKSITGSYERLSQKRTLHFGRVENSEVFFNEENAVELYSQLEVLEEIEDNKGTYILAKLPGSFVDVEFQPEYRNGNPTWITSVPSFPGYISAVGIAKMHRTFYDSMAAADEAAFIEILNAFYGRVEAQATDHTRTSTNVDTQSQGQSTISITAEGEIKGFYILARWRDEQNNYYSLAVCPVAQ